MENENKIVIRGDDNQKINSILSQMNALFREIEIRGHSFRLPYEFCSTSKKVPEKDAFKRIEMALALTNDKLTDLIDALAEIDPDFFSVRIFHFLEEWEKNNQNTYGFFPFFRLKMEVYIREKYPWHISDEGFL